MSIWHDVSQSSQRGAPACESLLAMVPLGAREHEGPVLAEAQFALRPQAHEGKLVAYGFAHGGEALAGPPRAA